MSATKPQSKAEQFLIEESESLSQLLYNQPFTSLDEERQARIQASAKRELKDRIFYEPEPGRCFNCGRETALSHQIQCWYCHEGTHPTQKQLWLENQGSEVQI